MHDELPVALEKNDEGHSGQVDAPDVLVKAPAEHGVEVVWLLPRTKYPGSAAVHIEAPAVAEKVPTAQGVGTEEFNAGQDEPAGQGRH